MALIHYNPTRWFDGDFDRMFAGFLPTVEGNGGREGQFTPRVDIHDGEDAIVLSAELPGIEKESVKVEVLERVLTLSGEKKAQTEGSENGRYRSERVYGAFERRFTLPATVDTEHIGAAYKDGVLRLTLPKKPEAKPRQITVEVKGNDA